jgi:hypothetical protein
MTLAADILTDLDTMIDTDEFAVSAMLGATPIDVIFNNGYAEELAVAGSKPTATCSASDVASVSFGDPITIPVKGIDTDYTIQNIQPDGTGEALLILEEV